MGTRNSPGRFDCYHAADPDEPMFILLARDSLAPGRVMDWAAKRLEQIQHGEKPMSDLTKVAEALTCAHAMHEWRIRKTPEVDRG